MSCCALGCQNRKSVNRDLKFYRIPSTRTPFNANRRRLWLQAIRRDDWKEEKIKNARLCSAHFISGEASMEYNSPDFVPSVFSSSTGCEINRGDATLERLKRKRDDTAHRPPDDVKEIKQSEVTYEVASEGLIPGLTSDDYSMEHSAGPYTESTVPKVFYDDLKDKYSQLSFECVKLRLELNKLKSENEELKAAHRTTFSFSSIKSKVVHVLFFTGLTSVIFEWLIHELKDRVEVVSASMNLEDHLLAILMKLRLGLSNQDVAFRFNVTESEISKTFRNWLPVMSATLKPLIKWPSKHAILKNMPKCFRSKYKHCRCIIDCTEILIDRPTDLTSRAQTFSTYRGHNTVKYLVGMSPAGDITFLSAGWGGRVSDKQIIAESGFYDLLEHNDEILADRGFTIRDELATHGTTLRIPHFTKGQKQLSAEEVDTSRRLSNARIHIERIIGTWKNFKILTTVIPLTQVDLLDDIMIICGALTNLCKCIDPRR